MHRTKKNIKGIKLIELLSVMNWEVHFSMEIVKLILLHQKKTNIRKIAAIDPRTIET